MANSISPNLILPPRQLSLWSTKDQSNDVQIPTKLPWVFHSLHVVYGSFISSEGIICPDPSQLTEADPIPTDSRDYDNNDDVITTLIDYTTRTWLFSSRTASIIHTLLLCEEWDIFHYTTHQAWDSGFRVVQWFFWSGVVVFLEWCSGFQQRVS